LTDASATRIVLVEDEPATRKLVQRQLDSAGYAVTACADGKAALDPISQMGTGIILADWSMPEMDGLELCRTVRELEEMQALGHVYFILLTAHDAKEQVVEGLQAGANDYLTKPYHPGELLARIQVGERFLLLQEELLQKTLEYQKANTQLAMLSRQLEESANTDALTGLANRRCLLERFNGVWELAQRNGHTLSCIMLDLDRFKNVNDTYGHQAGDRVLSEVSEIIRGAVRRPDLCGRVGGEEFVVVCPEVSLTAAVLLAERIRERVAARPIDCQGASIRQTVSGGVAARDARTNSPEMLLRYADAMMYAAKSNGRNQTWMMAADGAGERVTPCADVAAG
jgi:diguanylate cyclase (GGDEF)-like protein